MMIVGPLLEVWSQMGGLVVCHALCMRWWNERDTSSTVGTRGYGRSEGRRTDLEDSLVRLRLKGQGLGPLVLRLAKRLGYPDQSLTIIRISRGYQFSTEATDGLSADVGLSGCTLVTYS